MIPAAKPATYTAQQTAGQPAISDLPSHIASRITVDPESGCWVAGPPLDRNGYARLGQEGLHRVVYRLLVGEIPPGLVLDHVRARGCRHNACCRPACLEPVTHRTNVLRGSSFAAVNWRKTNCGTCGAPYDLINTYFKPNGHRDCRACIRRRAREYAGRQRERQHELRLAA